MLGASNAFGGRFLGDEDACEASTAPEQPQRRAQPMSLAQLMAAKRSGASGRPEEQPRPPPLPPYELTTRYERVEQAATAPRFTCKPVDYSAIQRRIAEQRERLRNESAAVIQRCVRRYQHHIYILQCRAMFAAEEEEEERRYAAEFFMEEAEQELPCDSVLIPYQDAAAFKVETSVTKSTPPPSPPIRRARTPVPHSPHPDKTTLRVPPPAPLLLATGEPLPAFLADVRLVSARGLLSDSSSTAGGVVALELSLCSSDGTPVVKRSTSQDLPPHSSTAAETAMESDTSLQFTGDGLVVNPQTIVDEWSVTVSAKVRSVRGKEVQGSLSVPLVLLETGLASEYALCRWFPLEKVNPGDLTRGELRLSIRVLARSTDATGYEVMAPYAPPKRTEAAPTRKETVNRAKSSRKPLPSRRGRRPPSTVTGRTTEPVTTPSPARERIPRVEAISPPSSPASTSSSDMVTSPIPALQQRKPTPRPSLSQSRAPPSRAVKTPERRVSLADRASRVSSPRNRSASPTRGEEPGRSDDDDGNDDDSKPKQPFLKRKPYKVVFQRLDWSTVPSKTDSRLATSNDKPVSVSSQYQPPYKSQPKPQSKAGGLTPSTSESRVRNGEASGASIDPMTRQRLEQLELAMNGCCGVSKRSTSVVHLKYETERKMFAITQAKRLQEMQATSSSSVEEIWKRLVADPTGEFYATHLERSTS